MELINITSQATGLELFLIAIGGIFLIAVIFTIMNWFDREHKRDLITSIILIILAFCSVGYSQTLENYTVYSYYVSEPTQVQKVLDNGYYIWYTDTDTRMYDLIQEK